MKTLYLIDNYSLGGAQTIVKGIMDNHPDNPEIFSVALRHKKPELEINNHRAVLYCSKSKFSIAPLIFLKRFIKNHEIEVIHCQLPRSIVFGYLLKRFFYRHLKYIIHEQGDIFESKPYAIVLKMICRQADVIIACSNATAEMMNRRAGIPLNKINVVYNFVDLQRFAPLKINKPKGYHIGFAGRIEKRKGWREFIAAAHRLQSEANVKFYIAGTGSELKKMTKLIDHLNLKNTRYLGFQANIESFYHSLDLLVIPSHFEPMGMVAVEAMACGVIVAASNVPGLNEVIQEGKNGYFIKPHSVESIVEFIKNMLKTNEATLTTLKNNALLDVENYSFVKFDAKINHLYKGLN